MVGVTMTLEEIRDKFDPKVPCMCCPVEVRGLYAVAYNLLNLRSDPDRWKRKIHERLDELEASVKAIQPYIDAHFENKEHVDAQNRLGL